MEVKKFQSFNLEIKADTLVSDDELYRFSAIFSTPNVDLHNDIVEPKAIMDSVAEYGLPSLLVAHDQLQMPAGAIEKIYQDEKGNSIMDGVIPKDELGTALVNRMKLNAYKASIGFFTLDYVEDEVNYVRTIKKIKLIEISLVPIPANSETMVTSVKQLQDSLESLESLKQVEELLRDKGFSKKNSQTLISRISQIKAKSDSDAENKRAQEEKEAKELRDAEVLESNSKALKELIETLKG